MILLVPDALGVCAQTTGRTEARRPGGGGRQQGEAPGCTAASARGEALWSGPEEPPLQLQHSAVCSRGGTSPLSISCLLGFQPGHVSNEATPLADQRRAEIFWLSSSFQCDWEAREGPVPSLWWFSLALKSIAESQGASNSTGRTQEHCVLHDFLGFVPGTVPELMACSTSSH